MIFYALAKQFYNVFRPIHHPYCRICGRVKEAYVVDDATRRRVMPTLDSLCFRHFDAQARAKGVRAAWRVSSGDDWPESEV